METAVADGVLGAVSQTTLHGQIPSSSMKWMVFMMHIAKALENVHAVNRPCKSSSYLVPTGSFLG